MVEVVPGYADGFARQTRRLEVLHVVPAEDLHGDIAVVGVVRDTMHIRSCFCRQCAQVLVALVVDEGAVGFYLSDELAESVHVFGEGGEDIDMVPRDAREDSDIGVVEEELGTAVEG